MTTYIYDFETDGFLKDLTQIFSLVILNTDTSEMFSCCDHPYDSPCGAKRMTVAEGITFLRELPATDTVVAHNGIKFDMPAGKKVYPGWHVIAKRRDTLLLSRLIWPEMYDSDKNKVTQAKRARAGMQPLPKNMMGKHSLEAWGHRLGEHKGEYNAGFTEWSPAMQQYCEQDCIVLHALWIRICKKNYSEAAIQMEHDFAEVMQLQEETGFTFDVKGAEKLYIELSILARELEEELIKTFKPWWATAGGMTPKQDNKQYGYTKDCPLTKVKLVTFNPGSRDHIAGRLKKLFGWKPVKLTPGGKPQVDETILSALPWAEAKLLTKYLTVVKRLGQVGEGPQAWLKKVRNGKIHGSVNTVGAVTRRCSHNDPNVAQTPVAKFTKEGLPILGYPGGWGVECRSCFGPAPGYILMGADASGLELRCLAHYMAKYDGGAYAKELIEGDIHSINAIALGIDPTAFLTVEGKKWIGRELAKRFIYAFLYGAGDKKIGSIVGGGAKRGKLLKSSFLSKTPAIKLLRDDIKARVKKVGYLRAIDGGRLTVRYAHAALNTLLQSAGSIVVKHATINFHHGAIDKGFVHGIDFALVAHIHDEYQTQIKQEHKNVLSEIALGGFTRAGTDLGFRIPIHGAVKFGANWAETH